MCSERFVGKRKSYQALGEAINGLGSAGSMLTGTMNRTIEKEGVEQKKRINE
jgi:hypothetical protein